MARLVYSVAGMEHPTECHCDDCVEIRAIIDQYKAEQKARLERKIAEVLEKIRQDRAEPIEIEIDDDLLHDDRPL